MSMALFFLPNRYSTTTAVIQMLSPDPKRATLMWPRIRPPSSGSIGIDYTLPPATRAEQHNQSVQGISGSAQGFQLLISYKQAAVHRLICPFFFGRATRLCQKRPTLMWPIRQKKERKSSSSKMNKSVEQELSLSRS